MNRYDVKVTQHRSDGSQPKRVNIMALADSPEEALTHALREHCELRMSGEQRFEMTLRERQADSALMRHRSTNIL